MLLHKDKEAINIIQFFYLVSAYEPCRARFDDLRQAVREALVAARETRSVQVVDQDSCDFCFHVYPAGSISVMARIRHFDRVEDSLQAPAEGNG